MLLSHAFKHWLYNELIVFILHQLPCTLCFTWKPIVDFPLGVKLQSVFQNRVTVAFHKVWSLPFSKHCTHFSIRTLVSVNFLFSLPEILPYFFRDFSWAALATQWPNESHIILPISIPTTVTSPHISLRAQPGPQSPSATPVLLYILLQCVSYLPYCSALRNFVTS